MEYRPGAVEGVRCPVMLQAMKEDLPTNTKCKDKFLIQSTIITPEKETLPLQEIVRWPASRHCGCAADSS